MPLGKEMISSKGMCDLHDSDAVSFLSYHCPTTEHAQICFYESQLDQ